MASGADPILTLAEPREHAMVVSKADNATMRALQKSNVSRYIQLASLFRSRIESGEWEVGAQIPTVKC